ncbi:ATP-binding protein [Hymenobacter terrenus]|uniref:ATP-binding protein n=1 Tax=Hymenobacter terrenus TaxID=1629124 RepID=UPI000697AD0C|nr:ATP-binding protein [Hymenobacter terrenus]
MQELAATVQDQRGLTAPVEPLDLRSVTDEVLLGPRTQVQESEATVELDFGAAPTLTYGQANLRSILHNLLSNALKFADPSRPPCIKVRSGLAGPDRPTLTVGDNGLGMILPGRPAPVFQPFARQHPGIGGAGVGVGMYLVQRIITSRGGHLEVASKVGEGTQFTIHWFDA